ncbi:hypothetical protein PsAD37_03617 [Pseudovibrio sp. Ad37]|nr:hypothetical protein PsAD37_03617 [Pseudovibrio sp. Ad37]
MNKVTNTSILAGVGKPPRLGVSTQMSVLSRLELIIKCHAETWYFLAFQHQFRDPTFWPILDVTSSGPNCTHRPVTDTLGAKGLILSILPPDEVSHEDWEKITEFYCKNSGKGRPLLVGQKLGSETIGSSPIWQDARFARKGTYVIGDFMFHVLEKILGDCNKSSIVACVGTPSFATKFDND